MLGTPSEGYFDFDYLGGTVDRHRLRYDVGSNPVRSAIGYGWLHPRPMPLHRLGDLFRIWGLLEPLGSTQRHEIEAALGTRLEQWRDIEASARPVYESFTRAVLQDAFTDKRWKALKDEDRNLLLQSSVDGLLLDATQFFDHVVKGDGNNL